MKARMGNVRRQHPAPMRQKLCSALLLALATCAAPAWAQRNDAPQAYSISAGDLASALDQLASQSKVQIIYPAELVRGKRAPAVSGQQTWREALQRLLAGSGLEWGFVNDTTVVIRQGGVPVASQPRAAPRNPPAGSQSEDNEVPELERLTVTGTRIRGGSTPSPVIEIGAERIQEEGFADLGEVIRSVPQNFNGGQNPGVVNGSSNLADRNISGGSALNLRGLGPDATLTLLNGRRMAYTGQAQAVDIASIPVEAVERLEIIPDGASAIYGSDAVGGVANVVLKRDFEGISVGTRHGRTSDGGLGTHEYTVTTGAIWSTGGLIATYKDVSVDPIQARQRDYTAYLPDPFMIYFGNKMRAGLVSAHQQIADIGEVSIDILKTDRELDREHRGVGFLERWATETSSRVVSPRVEFFLPRDWSLEVGGAYAEDENRTDRWFGDGMSLDLPLSSTWCTCNESTTYEIGAEGPLFRLFGGDARMAVGVGYRKNSYLTYYTFPVRNPVSGNERATYGYAELSLPFFSPESNVNGAYRLELSGALRSENYDSFGRVNTPKVGVVYGPNADFTLKASWGESFKAPTLYQKHTPTTAYHLPPIFVGGTGYPSEATALVGLGGNPNLQPEHARARAATLTIHPQAVPALQAELTWFDVDFSDRVVVPMNYLQALSNPVYAESEFVVLWPTPEEQASLLDDYGDEFINLAGAPYDPNNVVAIVRAGFTNVARQRVQGIDLSGSYQFDLRPGLLVVRGSASWLKSSQQTSVGQPEFDLAGEIFHPAKINSRTGVVWTRGGLTASGFLNYVSGVRSRQDTLVEKTASFTTFDTSVRYDTGSRGLLSDLQVGISIQNLFNRHPPLYTPTSVNNVPFDSSNYSAIGRFWSVSVSKHW